MPAMSSRFGYLPDFCEETRSWTITLVVIVMAFHP